MLKLAMLFAALILAVSVEAQKPCCGPKQFIAGNGATVGMVSAGVPQGFYTYAYGAFDFTGRQYGYFVNIDYPGGNSTDFRIILKYAENTQWIIDDARKTCEKQLAPQPEPSICIPSNASLATDMTIGGKGGLNAESWSYQFRSPHDPIDGYVTATVVQGSCYPLFSSLIGTVNGPQQAVPIVSTAGIVNMTIGIPNPDAWFKLPDFCEQEGNDVFSRRPRSLPELQAYHMPIFF